MTEISSWEDFAKGHGFHLGFVVMVALVFRNLSFLLEKRLAKVYSTEADLQVAVYRYVGLVHHTIQVPLACIVLSQQAFWADRLHAHSPLSFAMIIISSGYFLHDLVHAFEHIDIQGFSYVLHGAGCSAVFIFSLLQSPPALHFYGAGFLMWEISSFFVHFRWFSFKHHIPKKVQLINGLFLILTFFLCRIVWGFYLSYMFFQDSQVLAAHHSKAFLYCLYIANMALNSLNVFWFAMILKKAVETLSGKHSIGKRD